MRVPLEPHYSFTIPSIHDDTTLDCRIYHPGIFDETVKDSSEKSQWRKRGTVMAHPYAPMGGSYDDRIVGIVVDEMLKAGYVVGTFNFRYKILTKNFDSLLTCDRGAHGSTHKGRTSWSGRPELDDYTTFAACFMQYMSLISPFPTRETVFVPDQQSAGRTARQERDSLPTELPLVILGGYSYGSLVLKHLPPVLSILQRFSNPIAGSAADEVLMRAHKLADQSNLEWINQAQEAERDHRRKHERKTSRTIGGEETNPVKRRSSREVERSLDVPRSLDLGHRLRSLSHRRRRHGSSTESFERIDVNIVIPEIRYLLLSPLTPPISTLAAPALGQKLWSRSMDTETSSIGKFVSLAIYGDQDIFASAKKIRDWSDKLRAQYGPAFSSVEVTGAGHFWIEQGAENQLRVAVKGWACDVQANDTAITGVPDVS